MRKKIISALTLLSALALGHLAHASAWDIDPAHTTAGFKVRHLMIAHVKGELTGASGTLNLDDKDVTKSQVEVSLDMNTVNTSNAGRDKHLKTADFFDTQKFPKLTFKSTKIDKAGDKLILTGDLTMHGVTKPVQLSAELSQEIKDPWGKTRRGVTASGKINRKDFGLTWNKTLDGGGVAVGDEVELSVEAELTKKADQPGK